MAFKRQGKVIITSNFREAIEGAREGMEVATHAWTETTEKWAKANITRQESDRGYNLQELYEQTEGHSLGPLRARVVSEPFYARWFEYGTIKLHPMPYLRPAKRKGDKAFLETANVSVENAIRLRAGFYK